MGSVPGRIVGLILTVVIVGFVALYDPIVQVGAWAPVLAVLGVAVLTRGFLDDVRLGTIRATLSEECSYRWWLISAVLAHPDSVVRSVYQQSLLAPLDILLGVTTLAVLGYRVGIFPGTYVLVVLGLGLFLLGLWLMEDFHLRGPWDSGWVEHVAPPFEK